MIFGLATGRSRLPYPIEHGSGGRLSSPRAGVGGRSLIGFSGVKQKD